MRMEIPFNRPPHTGAEESYLAEAVQNGRIGGDGPFTAKCHRWLEERTGAKKALLVTSGTDALEMSALLCGIRPGDEVIMPSYTFVSTANAFVLRGARIVFVDIRPDTLNLDETLIEDAVTEKTRVIVPVHYAGVACEMDTILDIARRRGLLVVEDAAQGVHASYRGRALGTLGDYGCYSFHETKNYSMGEGGAVLVRDEENAERAEIVREKGTDRSRFLRGQVEKYSWVDVGSSYLPSDLNAAYLWAQLERADEINEARMHSWELYREELGELAGEGCIDLPQIPAECVHNAHMFHIRLADPGERARFIDYMARRGVRTAFHYVPLHSSAAGRRYGRFFGEDRYTTRESGRIVRLPMYYGLTDDEIRYVADLVRRFFGKGRP